MQTEEMRLDGNAAGGILREVFAHDMTTALVTCAGCERKALVGALLEYGHGMGVVLRCPSCNTPVLRIVSSAGLLRLDVRGIHLLTISISE